MYFLWKSNHYGLIKISCEGLMDFADDVLKSRLRLFGVALSPAVRKDEAGMNIVLSDEGIIPETKKDVESHFSAVFKPMGIKASVIWASPERSIMQAVRNPYVWAGVSACAAVLVTAGAEGFFWVSFWGAAAWFAVRGLNVLAKHFRSA
ncbi:MAG: hypothetical protein II954_09155 [Synergistaceae bacterium]|nr:hypothetical protein [Synergistaceae bacterium]